MVQVIGGRSQPLVDILHRLAVLPDLDHLVVELGVGATRFGEDQETKAAVSCSSVIPSPAITARALRPTALSARSMLS